MISGDGDLDPDGLTVPDRSERLAGGAEGWLRTDLLAEAVADGEIVRCEIEGTPVAVARLAEGWAAFADCCTHSACPFSQFGEIDGTTLICNCHGAEFDLTSGAVILDPAVDPLPMFDTSVRDGWVAVRRRSSARGVRNELDHSHIVIVGAGPAALAAGRALRAAGYERELTIVGSESGGPYRRPELSKQMLVSDAAPDTLALGHAEVEAAWRLGTSAASLDASKRQLMLAGGETLSYDTLILATGSAAARWPGRGASLPGVLRLRDADDALALRAELYKRPRVVILGAGVLGCEVASSARRLGLKVTLCDMAPAPMSRVGPQLGEFVAQVHVEHGVDVRVPTGISEIRGDEHVKGVTFSDGSTLDCDLIVVCIGAAPNTAWLAGSGLQLDDGVLCDETCTALGFEDVLVAGDIARWIHPLLDGHTTRVEHWDNALAQGRLAGLNALRPPASRGRCEGVPSFWSDQHGLTIECVGFPELAQHTYEVASNARGMKFLALGEMDGRLISAIGIGASKQLRAYAVQIADREPIDHPTVGLSSQP